MRDDGEGLANSGNKLAHVVNLANFNEREGPEAATLEDIHSALVQTLDVEPDHIKEGRLRDL